ncbi:hypothetical protein GCM10009839_03180 [Catenulispora yoronensis]|uniref:WD40 repeat domain-containing protein n=1 Tax=Catenulispora yoronensis TaxID=450799 RepID=A0ABN2TKB8_9ACTN
MDTDDPLYEIDLTDPEALAAPMRRTSRREALGLLAGTLALAGGAGRILIRDKGKDPQPTTLTVELVASSTRARTTTSKASAMPPGAPVVTSLADRSFEADGSTVKIWQTSDVAHAHILATTRARGVITSLAPRPPRARQVAVAGLWGTELLDLSNINALKGQLLIPTNTGDFEPWTAFAPDGRTLATCDTEHVVLWDLGSKTADLASRRTIPATLPRFTFVGDDLLAVAQTGDATIQFWRTSRTPAVIQTYTGPVGQDVELSAGLDGSGTTLTVVQTRADQSTTQILRITHTSKS